MFQHTEYNHSIEKYYKFNNQDSYRLGSGLFKMTKDGNMTSKMFQNSTWKYHFEILMVKIISNWELWMPNHIMALLLLMAHRI